MERWVMEECASLELGDKRLNQRAKEILSHLSQAPLASIPTCCKGWHETKAAYRYFSNAKVNSGKVLASHQRATIKRVQENKRVLMIQDTTDLDYSGQHCKSGVGPTRHGTERALRLHPSIVVSEAGNCLGVYDDYQWYKTCIQSHAVDPKTIKNTLLHKKHVSEKESYRWVLGYQCATALAKACPNTQVIAVADREGDLYDLYEEANHTQGIKADWLIRVKTTKRAIIHASGKRDTQLLHQKMLALEPSQIIEFALPRRDGETARQVQQSLRLAKVALHPPTGRRGSLRCHPVTVTVLLAQEINTPEGETPVVWWLMTSIPIEQLEQPSQLISWYLQRWQIEVFFRVLKSGCQVEQLQLETEARTRNCLAMYLIIAWRILFLTSTSRTNPDAACTLILEKCEWETAWIIIHKKPPPKEVPSIKQAIIIIAKMGGYLARKCDSPPGPKAIWQGITQLYHSINAIDLAKTYG